MKRHGTIHIIYLTRKLQAATPHYAVGFADYASAGGALKTRPVVGDDALAAYLTTQVGIRPDTVNSLLPALRGEGNASILDVALSDEELPRLGLE